jgi:hypothetical protein
MRPNLIIARRALAQLDRQQFGTSNTSLPPIQVVAAAKPKTNTPSDPQIAQTAVSLPTAEATRPIIPQPVIPKVSAAGKLIDNLPALPPDMAISR